MRIIRWPGPIPIRAAITEASNIIDPVLRGLYVVDGIIPAKRTQPSMAKCEEGGFALAFKMKKIMLSDNPQVQILKIFQQYWKEDFDVSESRYNLIRSFIFSHNTELKDYFVDFHFVPDALRVEGEILPGIRMDFVCGDTLGKFLMECRKQGRITNSVYATLAKEFLSMCKTFHRLGMAHGDLSFNNIIVTPDHHIQLIDYDSVFVPTMKHNFIQTTVGDANFQHPNRIKGDDTSNQADNYASNHDDNFSQIVIYTILLALSKDASVLKIINEDMVFMATDFENEISLLSSRAYNTMAQINDAEVNKMLQLLLQAVKCDKYADVPFLADVVNVKKPEPPKPVDNKYKKERVGTSNTQQRVSEEPKKVDGKYKFEIPKPSASSVGKKGERCVFCNFIISNGYPQANNCPNCGAPRVTYKIAEKV